MLDGGRLASQMHRQARTLNCDLTTGNFKLLCPMVLVPNP